MKRHNVDIFVLGRYYGTLRVKLYPPPFTTSEEELKDEIERRLPLLRNKKYNIKFA